ncbi:MAG: Crp/Fnr family transcriptional regulator [Deltaproteobacteria bacterium]|jgi:CRP/FNR family transcriptional regulator, dissimilatory nitrate respiration regulator|nr:Crp/Fnr family transcriptional regulator [Deltaproteobacteria bacterium]MBT6614699.1 Crp/Fnr family transcriptional regulator [Deltaproteobacteria bacterium]MBT7714404.1 Crp/Fnr family transcriptional regulator [Deltaproteobacteria bacterium]
MNTIANVLSISPLFSDLPEDHRLQIQQITIEKNYRKGETIFIDGDDSNGFYLIIDGQVKIFKLSSDGKEKILHIFGGGEPIGEVAMFSGRGFPANAETLVKSRLAFFPREAFVRLITEKPSLAMNMMAVLSKRLKQFAAQIEELSLKDVPGRLAGYLIYLAEEQGNNDKVTLNITKGQLASLLGTIPETLSRMMARMSIQKLIEVKGRGITIQNYLGLEDLAATGRFIEE